MGRITVPLGQMGANIETLGEKPGCAPLLIHAAKLSPITYDMPVASAQVKSAVLLAGLFAEGKTTVIQPAETRDHTERMLASFRVTTRREGNAISIDGGQVPQACDFTVPGDISSAAFWLVAAAALPGSRLLIKDVGLNPTRTAILKVLSRMGAHMTEIVHSSNGEPIGNIEIHGAPLNRHHHLRRRSPEPHRRNPRHRRGRRARRKAAPSSATPRNCASRKPTASPPSSTASARWAPRSRNSRTAWKSPAASRFTAPTIDSFGDHRIAMAFAIAGLFAEGETVIHNTDCVNTSYPGFAHHLDAILRERSEAADFTLPTVSHA